MDFPVVYASGRDGWAIKELEDKRENLVPLLDAIVDRIPAPDFSDGDTQMLITTLDYSDYVGRIGIGRDTDLPEVSANAPFKAVVVIEESVSPERRAEISKWLVQSGCIYMMA